MRDPETRRGVPLRAGVSLVAVAATVAATFALASPASAAAVTPSSVTISPTATTSFTNGPASDSGSATVAATAGTTSSSATYTVTTPEKNALVDINLSIPAPNGSGAAPTAPASGLSITVDTGNGAVATTPGAFTASTCTGASFTNCSYNFTGAQVTEATDQNTFSFSVTSGYTGSVAVLAAADNGSGAPAARPRATATQTVLAQNAAGPAYDVTKLTADPTSYTGYSTDGTVSFTVTATGTNGADVAGVAIASSVTPTSTVPTGPAVTAADGTLKFNYAASSLTGVSAINYTVSNTAGTSTSVSVNVANVGTVWETSHPETLATPSDSSTPPNTIQAGSAVNIPFSVTLHTTTSGGTQGAGQSGLKVGFDYSSYQSGSCQTPGTQNGTTQRVSTTTGSDGTATATVPVTALQAQNNYIVCVAAYLSGSSTAGAGQAVSPTSSSPYRKQVSFQVPAPAVHAASTEAKSGGTVTIPVSVQDQFGNLVTSNDTLSYTVSGSNSTTGTVTLSGGKATVTYTDAKNTAAGTSDTVAISDISHPSYGSASVTVTYVKSLTPGTLTFGTGLTTSESVDASATQTATVVLTSDQGDNLVGQPVTITVDNGWVGGTANKNSGSKTYEATTSTGGTATFYIGSTDAAKQTITATAGSVTKTDSETVTYTALSPYSVTLTGPKDGAVPLNGSATFIGKVTDEFGNPLAGETLQFTQSGAGSLTGGVSPLSGSTGANGTVSVTLQGGATAGSGSLTAYDPSGSFVTAADSNATVDYAQTAESKYTVGSSVSQVKVAGIKGVGVGGTEKIAVRVWNSDGSLAGGATVSVTVTGANTASGTATTGANGELGWFSYTAKHAGTDHVTATIDGKTATTTVTISSAVSSHLFHPVAQANGTFLYSVQTTPATAGARVNLFAVYHPGKADQALFHAGNSTTNANGRAARATSPGYLVHGHFKHYRAGQTYVLVAKVVGSAGQSNMSSATAK